MAIDTQLVNTGTVEAVIPHVLVTYYDEDGAVAWVQAEFLSESIRPPNMRKEKRWLHAT